MLAATQRTGPPTLVSFLPAFWLLIPGALGLVGVAKYLGDERIDGAGVPGDRLTVVFNADRAPGRQARETAPRE